MSSKKTRSISLLIVLLFNVVTSVSVYSPQVTGQDSGFFQQEIILPFDDNQLDESYSYQPIDLFIKFTNPCYAKSETDHSIQVFYEKGVDTVELESQIYQLDQIDEEYIRSCQLVFILPNDVSKNHQFFVQYSDKAIDRKPYPDHLSVEKSHYYYEPISGQVIDLDYYSINQDGFIPYGISYKGSIFGNGVSQVVARLKPNSKTLDTQKIDQFASFSMMISSDIDEDYEYVGTGYSTNPKTTVLLDGNLLVKIKIECVSPEGVIRTTNVYSYYYCPSEPKRMYVNCTHEILKDFEMKKEYNFDGIYAYLLSFHSKSEAIEKINMGTILPQLYLYGKDDRVHSYDIPVNPHSEDPEMILETTDDIDLGSEAWMCIHRPYGLKTHGLLFSQNHSLTQSDQDGIAVKGFVEETINLPGLEADTGSVFAARNHYDAGGTQDYNFEKGFTAQFDCAFITFQQGSWQDVSNESQMYQTLIQAQQNDIDAKDSEYEDEKMFTIKGMVTGVNSVPFGSALAAYTGKNFSYVTAELYQDDILFSSTIVSRIPFFSVSSDIDLSSVKQILMFVRELVDWKNSSIFQRFKFTEIPPGDYVVKIYKENPVFSTTRQYIGYAVVSVKDEDASIHIPCRETIPISVSISNQKGRNLADVSIHIKVDDEIIAAGKTDSMGSVTLLAPFYPTHTYYLSIFYKNIPITTKEISPSLMNHLITLNNDFKISLYDISVTVQDDWGLPSSIQLQPELVFTDESKKEYRISFSKYEDYTYFFQSIPQGTYTLYLSYKGFDLHKTILIDKGKDISLQFPLTYETEIELYNKQGLFLETAAVTFSREDKEKTVQLARQPLKTNLPPGTYQLSIYADETCIAKKPVTIFSDNHHRIVTMKDSMLPYIGYIISISLIGFSVFIGLFRHHYFQGLLLLFAGLILLSALSPWWYFSGENGDITVETRLHLLPTQMISFISSPDTVSGEFYTLPSEAILGIEGLLIFLISSFCILFFMQFINKKYFKIRWGLYSGSIALQVLFLIGFLFIISQLTVLGVGSSVGSGTIQYTALDTLSTVQLDSSWGFSYGFYIFLIALSMIIAYPLLIKRKNDSLTRVQENA